MHAATVTVTGLGAVTAAGAGAAAAWDAARAGRDGLTALSLFSSPRWGHVPVGQIPALTVADATSRSVALAMQAAHEALYQAGLLPSQRANSTSPTAIGLVVGACTGGMLETEHFARSRLHGAAATTFNPRRHHLCSTTTDALARAFELMGTHATISDACASGAAALAVGCDMIQAGETDTVLAGGVDVLTALTLNGFGALLVIDERGCRPFDRGRRGMSLGEAAAFVVLESIDSARRRRAATLGRVAGWASTCDAYHASSPSPTGDGIRRAMALALEQARLAPSAVGYINAHGSGTLENDRAEAAALRELFGEGVPPLSSVKRCFGHTLAAAGALEALVCLQALRDGLLPPSAGLVEPDPALAVEVLTTVRPCATRACLSNSIGFGGANTALVFTVGAEP